MTHVMLAAKPLWRWLNHPDWPRLDEYIAVALAIVFGSFFVFGKELGRPIFYLICLMPMILYIRLFVLNKVQENWFWRLSITLCVWWLVSIGWSSDATMESIYDAARLALALALFLTAAIAIATAGRLNERRLFDVIMLAAGLTGAIVLLLAWHPAMYSESSRLVGFGWAGHAGIGGDLYAFAGLVALVSAAETVEVRRRWITVVVLAICVTFVVLSESRGSVLAFICGALALGIIRHPMYLFLAFGVIAVMGIGAQLSGAIDFGQWVARGSSHRILIWNQTLQDIVSNPILGVGAAHVMAVDVGSKVINSTHNIVLAIQYRMGLPGTAIFLGLSWVAIRQAWQLARQGEALYFVALVFAYAAMMTHTESVVIMLSREWMIFWLPIVCLAGRATSANRSN